MIIEVDLQQHQDFTLKAVANSDDKCFFFFSDPFKIARVYNMSNIHRNGPFLKYIYSRLGMPEQYIHFILWF